ncbi:hypothetical protein ACP4OV_027674 [Aristida adscensionis]
MRGHVVIKQVLRLRSIQRYHKHRFYDSGQINTSISKTPALDPKERKKQREKERYARNKEEILRRKRERYHQKKAESRLIKKVEKEEANANESIAQMRADLLAIKTWILTGALIGDLTPTSMVIDGTSRIIVPALMHHVTDDFMPTSEVLEHVSDTLKDNLATLSDHFTGKRHPRDGTPQEQQQQDRITDSATTLDIDGRDSHNTPHAKRARTELTKKQIEARQAKDRAKYARQTDEQKLAKRKRWREAKAVQRSKLGDEEREAIKARQRISNMTSKKKQARIEHRRQKKELKQNILRGDSVAMENPAWVPEPTEESVPSVVSGSLSNKAFDFINFLEYKGSPIHIPSAPKETIEDVETFDMTAARRTKRRHVPGGERHALIARRNKKFQQNIHKGGLDTAHQDSSDEIDLINHSSEPPIDCNV